VLLFFIFLTNVILVLRSSCFDLRAWANTLFSLARSVWDGSDFSRRACGSIGLKGLGTVPSRIAGLRGVCSRAAEGMRYLRSGESGLGRLRKAGEKWWSSLSVGLALDQLRVVMHCCLCAMAAAL
jgi:hypothetical protein